MTVQYYNQKVLWNIVISWWLALYSCLWLRLKRNNWWGPDLTRSQCSPNHRSNHQLMDNSIQRQWQMSVGKVIGSSDRFTFNNEVSNFWREKISNSKAELFCVWVGTYLNAQYYKGMKDPVMPFSSDNSFDLIWMNSTTAKNDSATWTSLI